MAQHKSSHLLKIERSQSAQNKVELVGEKETILETRDGKPERRGICLDRVKIDIEEQHLEHEAGSQGNPRMAGTKTNTG